MSQIAISGNASGTGVLTIASPNTNSNYTLTLPASTGTLVNTSGVNAVGQIPFSTDGSTYTPTAKIVSGTSVASTSGTSIDFTGIPSWVKRITVMFNGVSTNGTSNIQVQLGDSGGIETTGYVSSAARVQGSATTTLGAVTSGFVIASLNAAADAQNGSVIFSKLDGNNWVSQGVLYATTYVAIHSSAGAKTLSDTLDRVRITTVNGTDTFDAGSINLLWE